MPTYLGPLSQYSSIDSDSNDTAWMADFQDFTSMDSSDDGNSDWIIDDDPLADLASGKEDLDLGNYMEYRFVDVDQRAALERVRHLYRDEEWGDVRFSELQGDYRCFRGPHFGPTQRHTRNRPSARSLFNLWWDDDTMNKLVRETNRYVGQSCKNVNDPRRRGRPVGTNGDPKWVEVTVKEVRVFFGWFS